MYSRASNRSQEPIQIPEHYSGCAFSTAGAAKPLPQKEPPSAPVRYPEATKPTPIKIPKEDPPPMEEQKKPSPPPLPIPLPPPKSHSAPHTPQPIQGLLGAVGSAFPFSHGLGFEELLLLGLILLLGRTSQDSDVVLWLALLLFCG